MAVRRVVKQLLAEMFQQCLSVSSCMWMHIVMEEHYTKCQRPMPFVLNVQPYAVSILFHNTFLALLWSPVA
jgi:hypothetical protein